VITLPEKIVIAEDVMITGAVIAVLRRGEVGDAIIAIAARGEEDLLGVANPPLGGVDDAMNITNVMIVTGGVVVETIVLDRMEYTLMTAIFPGEEGDEEVEAAEGVDKTRTLRTISIVFLRSSPICTI